MKPLTTLIIVLFVLPACTVKATRPDGSETSASIVALEEATRSSQECLEDAKGMWQVQMEAQAKQIPAGSSELLVGMIMMNQAFIQRDALEDIVGECMRQVAQVAQQYNLTDQQRTAMARSLGLAGIAGGFTYLSINSIANAFSQGMANAGGEYIVAGPGARIVNQQDRDYVYDDGFEIFGGDRSNSEGGRTTTPAGQAPGAVSASGDGDVVGNTMNINFTSGRNNIGTATESIGTFSPDPVVGSPTEGLSSPVTSQPADNSSGPGQ